jgi:hypothetical protein
MSRQSHTWGIAVLPIVLMSLISCQSTQAITNTPTPVSVSQPQPTPLPIATPQSAIAQVDERLTVVDYFLAAPPEQYFKILDRDQVSRSVRQKLLQKSNAVVDEANGYISTSSVVPDLCNYEMAVFRRTIAAPLVALNVSCTAGDTLTIFDPGRGWSIATDRVLPASIIPSEKMGTTIKLPRYGRTIKVIDEDNNVTELEFDGEKFEIRR